MPMLYLSKRCPQSLINYSWCKTLTCVVTLTGKSDCISPILEHLHWLPVHHCVKYKLVLLKYKIHHFSEPLHLHSQLVDYTPVRLLRSLHSHLLVVPRTKLRCASHAFSIVAPSLWNTATRKSQTLRQMQHLACLGCI